jgi:YHS domain-containing protein
MRIAPVVHALLALLLVVVPANAQMTQPKDALDGIDAVALLDQGKEISGKPEFKVTRGKFDYLFATAQNKAAFERNPEKYEIQLSGACARMGGGVTGNPADFAVVDGKIYIFGSDECHKKFVAAPAKFLPKPAPPMPTAAADVQAGRALLDKAVAAGGGAAKLDGVASYIETASQTQTRPQGAVTLTLKTIRRFPRDIRVERTMTMGDRPQTTATLITAEGGWFINGPRAYPQNPEGRTTNEQEYSRGLLPLLRARSSAGFKAAAVPSAVVDGVQEDRVRVKDALVDVTIGIDRRTGQVHSLNFIGRNMDAEIGDYTIVLADFRDVNGLKLPFSERALFNGQPDEFRTRQIQAFEINPAVDAALFKAPAAGGQ